MDYIVFGNEQTKLYFHKEKGYLEQIDYKNQIIPMHSKLWSVQTKTKEIGIADMEQFRAEDYAGVLKLFWKSAEAEVIVTLREGEDWKIRWNINVEVYGENAVSKVQFPILEGLNFEEENYLLITWQNGHLIKNPVDTFLSKGEEVFFWMGRGKYGYENEYPAGHSFQFSTFYSPEKYGFYFATEDGDAYIKTYTYYYNKDRHGLDYSVVNYPENMNITTSYSMPYDFVLRMYEGDWQTATYIYRAWATKQKWCKKKIVERKLPDNLVKTDMWWSTFYNYELGRYPQELLDSAVCIRDMLDCNIAVWWYCWNKGQHDVNYPDYMSDERRAEGWPEELREWNKKFDEAGIPKIIYINARLWERKTPSWETENVTASAIKNEKGETFTEPWHDYTDLRPVCPATAMWQKKVTEMCREYVRGEGFDGVYLDQIGSYNATLCFDPTHPHPIGGGTWWNDSYHNMLQSVRDVLGEESIITTESCCETYADVFDLMAVEDTNFQDAGFVSITKDDVTRSVPLFSMIYGDYSLPYASRVHFGNTTEQVEYNLVNNILWGILPLMDAASAEDLKEGKYAEMVKVLKRCADFYKEYKPVFLYGRLCEIPEYTSATYEVIWSAFGADGSTFEYAYKVPAVNAAIWETAEGGKVLLAYNYSDAAQKTEICGREIEVPAKSFYKLDM